MSVAGQPPRGCTAHHSRSLSSALLCPCDCMKLLQGYSSSVRMASLAKGGTAIFNMDERDNDPRRHEVNVPFLSRTSYRMTVKVERTFDRYGHYGALRVQIVGE